MLRYRILRDAVEVYQGTKTAVTRKLVTLSKKEDVGKLAAESRTTHRRTKEAGRWTPLGSGTEFLRSQ